MNTKPFLFAFFLISLIGCSTTKSRDTGGAAKGDPETVLITYHVKPGKEAEFQDVLSRAWGIYRKEHLVFAQPHLIVQVKDGGDTSRTAVTEIFTWVSHAAPDHAPASVKKIWDQMQSLCETRDGRRGIEGGEVDLLAPPNR